MRSSTFRYLKTIAYHVKIKITINCNLLPVKRGLNGVLIKFKHIILFVLKCHLLKLFSNIFLTGDATDALAYHNQMHFTTKDSDNDAGVVVIVLF